MTTTVRQLILRADALYIGIAGFAEMIFDIALNLAAAMQLSSAVRERTTLQGAR